MEDRTEELVALASRGSKMCRWRCSTCRELVLVSLVSRTRRGPSAGEAAGFAPWQLWQHFLGSWWLLTPLRTRQDRAEQCPNSFFAERGGFARQRVCQPNLGALAWSHPDSFSSLLWQWIF